MTSNKQTSNFRKAILNEKTQRELSRLRWVMIGCGAIMLILEGIVFIKELIL